VAAVQGGDGPVGMTAEHFDRLLYTDCKPGTGRGAGGGFQVQAQSADVDSAQSQLAVGWLLYDVQLPWLTQRRPVEEFPPGFAHAGGEIYGTAQSRYLGKVATGGRDGNHLADCLLTRNPDLYGPVRPAQLWGSGLWRREPWDGKDCPKFDAAELEPGPLTVDAVAEWARSVPERGPVLTRLLSTLEDPGGKRVVIVTDDSREAMTWIAAVTLLLPSRAALGVSFKVFSSAPLDAQHRVVAAPALLFPKIAPGMLSQRFVLDAQANAADEAEISERAAFFAGHFTADGDPYDVVDAVELTDVLGGGQDARLTAWALTCPACPRPKPEVLFRWLASAGHGLLAEYGPAVTAILLDLAPPADALLWIDNAVTDKRLDSEPAAVRGRLLAAELAGIRDGRGAPPPGILPFVPLDSSAHRDAESELSSAILLGSDQQVDLLLRLAHRHGIDLDLAPPLQRRLRDFVSSWIDRPGAYRPDNWAMRAEVLDCVHDELRDRLAAKDMTSIAGAIRQLNRYLGDRADLSDLLDYHIQASLIASEDRAYGLKRLRQLLDVIGQFARSPARSSAGAVTAPVAAATLQRALIGWQAVDGEVAVAILIGLPDSLDVEPEISQQAAEQLTRMSAKPSRTLLDLLASLDSRGKAPSSRPLGRLLEDDRYVRTFLRRAFEDRLLNDSKYFHDVVSVLRRADAAVVEARLDEVLSACLETRHPDLGPEVLSSPKSPVPQLLVQRWGSTLGTRDLVKDALWCVRCLDYEDLPAKRQEQLATATLAYAKRLAKQDFDRWYGEVARQLRLDKRAVWEAIFVQEESRSRLKWINRGGGQS
jgi:GTPase-associated protein 1, N-terminal domain type 2/GTPase-associated protein 1, middle domain